MHEHFKRLPVPETPGRGEEDLIDSYPVIIRVGGQWVEATAVPDVNSEGRPYIRFESINEPRTDDETEDLHESEELKDLDIEDDAPFNRKPEVDEAIGSLALTVTSLSGGEGIVDASGSRIKTIKYEPAHTTILPTVKKTPTGKHVPALRVAELDEPEEN